MSEVGGGRDDGTTHACERCGAPMPTNRSVCPSCGLLQHDHGDSTDQHRTGPARPPRPSRPDGADAIEGGPIGRSTAPAEVAPAARPHHKRRRSPWKVVAIIVVVLACIGGAAYAFTTWQDDDTSTASSSTATTTPTRVVKDAKSKAVLRYCDDPRALTQPKGVATFTPGAPAVAYVVVPQPPTTTVAKGDRVVQVSPKVGKPNLDLDASIGLVSLAVCMDERSTSTTASTCDYTLTNPSSLGDEATEKLITTTYDVTVYELKTGKQLVTDTMTTSDQACPEYAYTGGSGVSNPVTDAMVLMWLAKHLPGGKPI